MRCAGDGGELVTPLALPLCNWQPAAAGWLRRVESRVASVRLIWPAAIHRAAIVLGAGSCWTSFDTTGQLEKHSHLSARLTLVCAVEREARMPGWLWCGRSLQHDSSFVFHVCRCSLLAARYQPFAVIAPLRAPGPPRSRLSLCLGVAATLFSVRASRSTRTQVQQTRRPHYHSAHQTGCTYPVPACRDAGSRLISPNVYPAQVIAHHSRLILSSLRSLLRCRSTSLPAARPSR